MGPRVMKRPPKYVHGFIDRHGRPRFYFRRAGFKKMPLPGLPWSPEFMAAYQDAKKVRRASKSAPPEAGLVRSPRPSLVTSAQPYSRADLPRALAERGGESWNVSEMSTATRALPRLERFMSSGWSMRRQKRPAKL
jgi:hypothetical protein